MAGRIFFIGATVIGTAFLAYGAYFARARDARSARQVFLVSALYLPHF